jgi:hypothetical protein
MGCQLAWGEKELAMIRFVLITRIALVPLLLTAAGVHAKPHDIRIQLKMETVKALHTPTGCVSSVELNDGQFVKAFITDPQCLPKGVARRHIPAKAADFQQNQKAYFIKDR